MNEQVSLRARHDKTRVNFFLLYGSKNPPLPRMIVRARSPLRKVALFFVRGKANFFFLLGMIHVLPLFDLNSFMTKTKVVLDSKNVVS